MNTSINEAGNDEHAGGKVRVPVHEDYLYDCDIEQRELSPGKLIRIQTCCSFMRAHSPRVSRELNTSAL